MGDSYLPSILAVSSPPGRSARGIVRISGDQLGPVIAEIFDPIPGRRRLTGSRLTLFSDLPCLALYHPAPNSYTGQDALELQIPGNPALIERVLHGLLAALRRHEPGARFAEPGEFTQRTFMAGRIDLTRAEGIAATISAVSDAQLQAAKLLRTGRLGQWAEKCVNALAELLALVEAGIDFVDQDDVVAISPQRLDAGLASLEAELESMLARSRSWSALESLPWVVLAGRPNSGKSTLFNALLGRERAITSNTPGTTRDVLAEPLRIATPGGEAEVMLVDVAGLDEAEGAMNRAMQVAAHNAFARAELIVMLLDPLDPLPTMSVPRQDVAILYALTKADLRNPDTRTPHATPLGVVSQASKTFPGHPLADVVRVSALTGEGLDELRRRIAHALRDRAVTLSGEMLALTPRHRDELAAALDALHEARTRQAPELAAESMRRALDHLAALGGQVTADDIIGRIFATFCIGK